MLLMVSDRLVMVGGGVMVQTNSFNFILASSLLETHMKKREPVCSPFSFLFCFLVPLPLWFCGLGRGHLLLKLL